MCGRFIQIANPDKIKADLPGLMVDASAAGEFTPRYNIAPTQSILTVLNTPVPSLAMTHWGLIPSWAKDRAIGGRMINARAETLQEKPSFRVPFRRRRCIILADGFYEWQRTGKGKTPHFIRMKSREPFGLAGLWDTWRDPQTGLDVLSSTIITTSANAAIAPIHDRMPSILDPGSYLTWLNPGEADASLLLECLAPFPSEPVEAYPVSGLVNNPRHDSEECIRPA